LGSPRRNFSRVKNTKQKESEFTNSMKPGVSFAREKKAKLDRIFRTSFERSAREGP